MPFSLRVALTALVSAAALALIIARPRGLPEAYPAALGGALLVALGLVRPSQVLAAAGSAKSALLFLLSLLLLSALVEKSGFFEWAAARAARLARGSGHALLRNVFVLGALVTAALSLDTTAVILTPLVLAATRRLGLPARPYVLACAFVANMASLPLPISNLTNLLFAEAFRLPFAGYALRMALPQAAALLVAYAAFRLRFRAELPARFDPSTLDDPRAHITHVGYFRATGVVLALVLAGYFAASILGAPPYVVCSAGALGLFAAGLRFGAVRLGLLRELSWGLFPFVLGLFTLVQGVENLGAARALERLLSRLPAAPLAQIFGSAFGTAVLANAANNLPAALIAARVLASSHASPPAVYGALLGADIGPTVAASGSLATMLVLAVARRQGEAVGARDVLALGAVLMPLALAAACLALGATYLAWP